MSHWTFRIAFAILALSFADEPGQCVVFTEHGGKWPSDWPVELEPLRASATTIDVATGTQEHIYEIAFATSDEFIKAWPALLRVRTPGSPLSLRRISVPKPGSWESIASNSKPKVRIFAPVANSNRSSNISDHDSDEPLPPGKKARMLPFKLGPPWPVELVSSQGELPEYVQAIPRDGKAILAEVKSDDKSRGFRYRARVDIELVVDGKVIDVNRLEFPKDALIVDHRFEEHEPSVPKNDGKHVSSQLNAENAKAQRTAE
jgi:hypothetical protein